VGQVEIPTNRSGYNKYSFFGSQLLPYNTATESTVKVGCILITITRLLFYIYSY